MNHLPLRNFRYPKTKWSPQNWRNTNLGHPYIRLNFTGAHPLTISTSPWSTRPPILLLNWAVLEVPSSQPLPSSRKRYRQPAPGGVYVEFPGSLNRWDRWYIITQLGDKKYHPSHLLGEPEISYWPGVAKFGRSLPASSIPDPFCFQPFMQVTFVTFFQAWKGHVFAKAPPKGHGWKNLLVGAFSYEQVQLDRIW